jgi:exoribonuclease-2
VLGSQPEAHSGLGLEAYVTATSPIRKYFDLITQRQIRAVLGLENFYSREEIDQLIQSLGLTMGTVSRIQGARQRYWLLKHLETRIGEKTEAIVLSKRRNSYTILLNEYMMECSLPLSNGISLKPEDLVQVKIQHASARKNMIAVYMG